MILSRFAATLAWGALVFSGLMPGQTAALPTAPTTTPPPQDPKVIEDGGFSIEPFYWFTQAQPRLYGGKQAFGYSDLSYPGKSKRGYGGEIAFPAGRANTLRFSYFKVQGHSNTLIASQGATIFGETYAGGDAINASYTMQNAKVSWDYLSYTFKNHVRFKTLYEFQYVTISTATAAPLVAETINSNTGETDMNSSTGSKHIFYPTLGVEFEQPIGKHMRWELKGSGFGLPHHALIWDAQADLAFRVSKIEFFVGGKAFHFKTSENTDQYFTDTLEGAFVGVRYYLSKPQQ